MTCGTCGHQGPDRAKFCPECGTPAVARCASCGVDLTPGAKFCLECGAKVGDRPVPASAPGAADVRKVVTIVFADLVGSTALHERLDAESTRQVMERYYAALRAAVDAQRGRVVKLLGDGVMAAFGLQQVAEDDALRAVRAGVAMQAAFRALREQAAALGDVGLRVAVNTGEVVVSGAQDDVIGDPANVAARLQEQGRDGDVVLGEATRRLVATRVTLAPLGSVTLKGRAEAVAAYRLVSLDPPAGAAATPFVGRDDEIARLGAVYDAAVATPAARLAVLLGSPGLGKSRLIDEFTRRHVETSKVLAAHCDAAGGATFAPLAAAIRAALGLDDGVSGEPARAAIAAALPSAIDDTERTRIAGGVAGLLGGAPTSPEETFFVVRRFLAGLAVTTPVILVIDDLHWAEPLLLDLVEHLVQWGGGVPLFVLVGARPELRDLRSTLATPGGLVTDVITLDGLDAGAAMRLAANVIGAADLPAAVAVKVLAASEGNPLFVGELVRMLVQEGALTKAGDRWTIGAGLASMEMPPTIHALLAARIERLRPEERTVLERAAVVGRHFSRSAVATLLGPDGNDLDARLESLRRSELIERDTGWLLGEPALRFHHVLIRDAAYRRLLKGTRAELHERLADWIEAQVGDAPEHDEMIGWHFEQAHQHLRELGSLDARGQRLGERASQRLGAAGRRALARDDTPLAAGLLGRAIDRLMPDSRERADLALDWCEALLSAGDVGPAGPAIDAFGRVVADSARLRAWHTCFAGQLVVLTAPEALQATADRVGAAARDLAALGDAAGEAKAHFVHAQALARLGKVGACEAALDLALAAARQAGDRRRANAVLAGAPLAALWGPSPVTRASGRCLDVVRVLRITQGAPAVEAVALSCQGVLEALRGRTDAARRMIGSARTMVEELGIAHRLFEADAFAGRIDLLEGNAAAAERTLRGAYEGLRDLGLGIDAAGAAALLARALLAQGCIAEAEACSRESEALAGDDLQAGIAWRGARAEALAKRGDHDAAVALAQAAVSIAAATDALLDHADARVALAAALRAAGRGDEADTEERRAIDLWEAKGATLLAERLRKGGAAVAPLSEGSEPRVVNAPATRRAVRANAATGFASRFTAALAARDFDAVLALLSEDYQETHHPTGSCFGRAESVDSIQRLFRSRHPVLHEEPLATLGDALCLRRRLVRASGAAGRRYDVGEYENETITLLEVDDRGLARRQEVFAADHLDAAVARAYERYAELLPEGPARERAAATARAMAMQSRGDSLDDRWTAVLAPDFESIDHRQLGTWSLSGASAFIEHMGALREVASEIVLRDHAVLALEPNALLVERMHSGNDRLSGGAYERPFLVLFATDVEGRLARAEWFDAGHEAEALARYEALVSSTDPEPAASEPPFANAASRAWLAGIAAWTRRDAEGFAALQPRLLRYRDHRRLFHLDLDREEFLAFTRPTLDMAVRASVELLATRGERLALKRFTMDMAEDAVGPSAIDSILLIETDDGGDIIVYDRFDAGDVETAWAALDARWVETCTVSERAAVESNRAFTDVLGKRDWNGMAASFAPDFVAHDHRLLGWGTMIASGALFVQTQRALVDLAPDARYRLDHFRGSGRVALTQGAQMGTRDGGPFESPFLIVSEIDATGRSLRMDVYDVEQLDQARARFDAIGAAANPLAAIATPNAAFAVLERWRVTFESAIASDDSAALRDMCAPEMIFEDRRRMALLSGDRDMMIASARERARSGGRLAIRLVGTAGDRVAVAHLLWSGGPPDGRWEIEYLGVLEIDAAGSFTALIFFDTDVARAAQREAWARWVAIDPAVTPWVDIIGAAVDGFNAHDRKRLRESLADDIVVDDHRRTGFGRIQGADAHVDGLGVLWDLAPDHRADIGWFWPAVERHGVITLIRRSGTLAEGGEFESEYLWLCTATGGRITRLEFFEVEDLVKAKVRLAELRPDPLRIPPNAATRSWDRWYEAGTGHDWDTVRALAHPSYRIEDRRRLFRMTLDREASGLNDRILFEEGWQATRTILATAGDRLALQRILWRTGEADAVSEIEILELAEVDGEGRFVSTLVFDPGDRTAASAELLERYVASGPDGLSSNAIAIGRAWNAHDLERLREMLPAGFYLDDRRRTGVGRLEGVDAYLTSLAAVWELSSDLEIETLYVIDTATHGTVYVCRWFGTNAEGGDFDAVYVCIGLLRGDEFAGLEIFEIDDLDLARARFDDLARV